MRKGVEAQADRLDLFVSILTHDARESRVNLI